MLFLPRQTSSKFYSQDSSLCAAVEMTENIVSLLSEQHYLNKMSKISVLKGRGRGDMLICRPHYMNCIVDFPSPDRVSISVTLSRAQSWCLDLRIYEVGPGLPFIPPSLTLPLISRLSNEYYV